MEEASLMQSRRNRCSKKGYNTVVDNSISCGYNKDKGNRSAVSLFGNKKVTALWLGSWGGYFFALVSARISIAKAIIM